MSDLKRRCLPAEPRKAADNGSRFGYVGMRFGVGIAPTAKNGAEPPADSGDLEQATE